jgi:hypothetical protein
VFETREETYFFPQRQMDLERALGIAIGALEMIEINPHSINYEGLQKVLAQLKAIAENRPEGGE